MNDTKRPCVLLVDDHPVVRAGFRYLLEQQGDYAVEEAGSAEEAYSVYGELQPDVVVLDLSMPGMGGLEGVRRLRAKYEDACILILSMFEDPTFVQQTRDLGAMGYLTKGSASDQLGEAIASVLAGKHYYSKDIAGALIEGGMKNSDTWGLSAREFEVFCLLAQGRSVVDVAEDLHVSHKTVNNHRTHILQKLDLKNGIEMARFAIRHRIIEA